MSHSLVLLEYVDLHGDRRGLYIPPSEWQRATEQGVSFGSIVLDHTESANGRSIGDAPSLGPETGEIAAVADPQTRTPIPWVEAGHERAACRIHRDSDPSPLCSRTTLAAVCAETRERGYSPTVGTDYEFTLYDADANRPTPTASDQLETAATGGGRPYHTSPLTDNAAYFDELHTALDRMGVALEGIHKESAPGLYEAIIAHTDPLAQADAITKLRSAIRGVGAGFGLRASFIPRPFDEAEGNSQHYHCSLQVDGANAFVDDEAENGISTLAKQFVAGVMAHADGLTAVCAPTVNSYRRLQPGLWAPITVSYGFDNKSCLVRIPPERGERTRVEVRLPDSFANPHLALAAVFAAGLDGIDRDLDPGEPTATNVFEGDLDQDERIPVTLGDALDALEADAHLVDALGAPLVAQYVRLKRDEIDRFRSHVTDWEVREYADRL